MVEVSLPVDMLKGIVRKGSVALDGISLTVVDLFPRGGFSVSVIPHTADTTTLGARKKGDTVNIELDMMGKYVQKKEEKGRRITEEFLREKGFI